MYLYVCVHLCSVCLHPICTSLASHVVPATFVVIATGSHRDEETHPVGLRNYTVGRYIPIGDPTMETA